MTVRWRTTLTANMKWPARWTSHNMKWQVRWTSHDMKWQARWTFHNMKWQARWISQNEILRRNYLNYNNFILNMQISKRTTIKTRHIIVPVPIQYLYFQRRMSCSFSWSMIWGERRLVALLILVELRTITV